MKKNKKVQLKLVIIFLFSLVASEVFPQNNGQEKFNIEGAWQGALNISGITLRIVFNIKKDTTGNLTATMDSPDQRVKNIPVEKVTFAENKLKIEMPAIKGKYEGTLSEPENKIEGTWTQAEQTYPLNLVRTEKPIVINRPQEPKEPFPYNSTDVSYENKKAGVTLAGTFTSPKQGGPFPAVLLITGSGAQNRNEELLGHKPFLVLSDYLTRRGIAVLRVDDRGVGKSTGTFSGATSKDFAGDVLAGVEYLKTRKDVNPKEIGLIGHSEGGLIAPMVAVESKDVAFIVLMAGPGLPGDQILLKQSELISRALGESENNIRKSLDLNKKIYDVVKTEKDSLTAYEKIKIFFDAYFQKLTPEEKAKSGDEKNLFKQLRVVLNPWYKFFISYNPAPTLEKVKCPVLAIDGEKDLQVPPKEDLDAIANALKKGGNKNFRTVLMPGLNHLFQTAKTGAPSEYSTIEETISPNALKTISDWILEITKK